MNKKKRLLDLFTQDVEYNYHLVRTIDPNGHLLYLMKNDSTLGQDSLEFAPTVIIQELLKNCSIEVEKFAPAIFWTDEFDTEELKSKLNKKLTENIDFSNFIESIRDKYRILEIQDSLLYKKDPEAYTESKRNEYAEHQKELMEDFIKQHQDSKKKREEKLLAYNNNLIKLLKEYFEDIIEFEKRDFDFTIEFEKIVSNLIDPETWIKIEDVPFECKVEICSLSENKMKVHLTNNNDYSFTATLRFEKTQLITEDIIRIDESITCPRIMSDYDVLVQLYDINVKSIPEWIYKNETDRFEYIIDHLVPIFKESKEKIKEEFVNKINKSEKDDQLEDFDKEEEFDDENDFENNNKKKTNPSDWYFDVFVPEDVEEMNPSVIALSEDGSGCLDDQLGSHNLPQNIINALNRAGIFGDSEMMEAMWEVNDSISKTKEDIIKSMEKEGFIYVPNMLN